MEKQALIERTDAKCVGVDDEGRLSAPRHLQLADYQGEERVIMSDIAGIFLLRALLILSSSRKQLSLKMPGLAEGNTPTLSLGWNRTTCSNILDALKKGRSS
jgi:hypothetical protein